MTELAAMERPKLVVTLDPEDVRVEVPALGLAATTPLAVGLTNERGRVFISWVGAEALALGPTLPDGTPVLPWRESTYFAPRMGRPPADRIESAPASDDCCVVINPLRAETRDLEVLERFFTYALAALLAGQSWLARSRSEIVGFRYVVCTRGLDADDALKDTVALALTSYAPGPVTVDGERWYGPYAHLPPHWTPPRMRSDPEAAAAGLLLYGAAGAMAVARLPARAATMMLVGLLVMAARDGRRVWRYYRRERQREAQRLRHR